MLDGDLGKLFHIVRHCGFAAVVPMAMAIPSNAIVQQPLANVRPTPLWCSYVYRRTSRTLPGMTLRFPGLGMPLYSPAENLRFDERAGSARRWGRGETLPGRASQVVEAGSEGLRDGRARDRGMLEHGDLVVEALVKLPVGETICLDFRWNCRKILDACAVTA